jgi:hypothetical protein
MRALEKHPEDRYQTAYDLADDLESFLRDEKLHSGPVRIARYLDMLAIASGGTRRPELISEAEARAGGDELDFDSQVFEGYAPSEGAPGPEQAPLWEDVDQPEADVAAALHLELAELRALRTPVPVRPSGMHPVRGDSPLLPAEAPVDDEPPPTNPVRRMQTSEIEPESDESVPTQPVTPPAEKPAPLPLHVPAAPAAVAPRPSAPLPGPTVGAGMLARSGASKLPWMLVIALALAVAGLLAYIVIK